MMLSYFYVYPLDRFLAQRRFMARIPEAEIERLPWEDEKARARLVSEVWGDKDHAYWMAMGMDEDED